MAGGVALNCVANGQLQRKIFLAIFIFNPLPVMQEGLWEALAAYYLSFEGKRRPKKDSVKLHVSGSKTDTKIATFPSLVLDEMQGGYLGPSYSKESIRKALKPYAGVYTEYARPALYDVVAGHINEGAVVGWFQGRMEFGPRALGARSIIADPRRTDMQKKLNLKIKYRESFRPFAPSVLWEDAQAYFGVTHPSPYMLQVYPVSEEHRNELPVGFDSFNLRKKLAVERSDIPAITHIDFRREYRPFIQSLMPIMHLFYRLLKIKPVSEC